MSDGRIVPDGRDSRPNGYPKKIGEHMSLVFAALLCVMAAGLAFERKEGWFRPDPPAQVWVLIALSSTCLGIRVPADHWRALQV